MAASQILFQQTYHGFGPIVFRTPTQPFFVLLMESRAQIHRSI
jgi:hypothetical protein